MGLGWNWGLGLGVNVVLTGCSGVGGASVGEVPVASPAPTPTPSPAAKLTYSLQRSPQAVVHILRVPAQSQFTVRVAAADQLQTVEQFAVKKGAIAVLNAGFFDPVNQKTTSPILIEGRSVGQPEANERLMGNPDLVPYLDKILNRSEFRQLRCGGATVYDIALRQALPPTNCQVEAAIGGGPQLLPTDTAAIEGFIEVQNGQLVRDALGYQRPNARSAVGILANGDVLLVMAAQIPGQGRSSGVALPELAAILREQGAVKAMNLDGGSSAGMYYQGELFYGQVSEAGVPVERAVKSVLWVAAPAPKTEKPGN